jgi:uncharacterized membrane protein YfcA
MYPMQVGTGFSGRKTATGTPHLSFTALVMISLIGGTIGAVLLLMTPSVSFGRFVPWLMLLATLSFAWGSFRKTPTLVNMNSVERKPDRLGRLGAAFIQFTISVYGGYFGGGIGLMMLATLTYAGMNMKQAITTKNILAAVMNTSAVGVFLLSTNVHWLRTSLVAIAAIAGGIVGIQLMDKVNERYLRIGVTAIGLALTAALFWRAHV